MKNSIKFIVIFFVLFWILLISRIYFISIKSNTYYDELAKRNIIKTEYLTPPRGMIEDRNGINLAVNKLGFSIYLIPHLTRKSKKEQLKKDLDYLSKYFPKFKREKIYKTYKRADTPYNHRPIQIVNFINYNDLISKYVSFLSNKDFSIKPNSKRFYPFGSTASHVIGYVAKATTKDIEKSSVAKFTKTSGKNGIEKYYNTLLEGELGYKKIKVTALNKEVSLLEKKRADK
jgi:penicillin-binding protein 2